MKVRVSTLPSQGLPINSSLDLEALNTRMQEGKDNEIVFTSAPQVNLTIFRTTQGAETKGTVSTRFKQSCARCTEVIERDLEVEANFQFAHIPEDDDRDAARPEDYQDDVGISFFEGDHIELDAILEEALILALSPFWSPPLDPEEKCTLCSRSSKDFTFGSVSEGKATLGSLFKKAGVH